MPTVRTTLAALAAVTLGLAGPAAAADYDFRVVATNLHKPTGIAARAANKIYFTQLPTPGVPRSAGGSNTVSLLNANSGHVRHLVAGEPEPTGLTVTAAGSVFWTCKSAGVINTFDHRGRVQTLRSGLDKPTGISALPCGVGLFYTEVPTPGVSGANGGRNKVSFTTTVGNLTLPVDLGDPEPTDVTVDAYGAIYWTCSSAGVIVRFTPTGGEVILADLERPTGIANDGRGNLYFTEVPTPGVSGANGGRNAVYKYNTGTRVLTLIDEGDPEPTDIAALANGTVYWTCTSAGVIVEATPRR